MCGGIVVSIYPIWWLLWVFGDMMYKLIYTYIIIIINTQVTVEIVDIVLTVMEMESRKVMGWEHHPRTVEDKQCIAHIQI